MIVGLSLALCSIYASVCVCLCACACVLACMHMHACVCLLMTSDGYRGREHIPFDQPLIMKDPKNFLSAPRVVSCSV